MASVVTGVTAKGGDDDCEGICCSRPEGSSASTLDAGHAAEHADHPSG